MTLADRSCDACGGFVSWRDAKRLEGDRCLCPKCATAPKEDPTVPKNTVQLPENHPLCCTTPGCRGRRFKKVSDKENLCYRCLRTKHPNLLPASHRPKGAAPPRKLRRSAGRSAARHPMKRHPEDPPRCHACGQLIPDRVLEAAEVLRAHGVKDRTIAIKASALILSSAGQRGA